MVFYSKFIFGTNGADKITATDEAHLILGMCGNDTIIGGSGNDSIYGDAGNDMIQGGTGNDTRYGGGGSNIFVLGKDRDVVKDFTLGSDKIQIALGDADASTVEAILTAAELRIGQEVVNSADQDRTDTVIYNSNGTADIADDIALMVLEDFSQDLTINEFSII